MRNPRVRLLVVSLVAVGLSLSAFVVVLRHQARPAAAPGRPVAAIEVLRAWDAQRASAWAVGDEVALRRLYVPGSRAGARDLGLLRAYRERGLVVRGMRMQVLAVRVLESGRTRWVLEVTDRLVGAIAVGPGLRRRLPEDAPTRHRITLKRTAGVWQVLSVRRLRTP